MCIHEDKIRTALKDTFGEHAERYFGSINAPSFNLGGKTPLDQVKSGGCVTSAVEAIRPSASGC